MDKSRRTFMGGAGLVLAGATLVAGRGMAAEIPEAVIQESPAMQPPLYPTTGRDYQPVVTLNGWTLPFRMKNDWKEFHLVAEPVVREIAPGMKAHFWGYNGQSPGPTIEVVEGDKVRIFVTNKLPEHTTVHWHGVVLPSGMDGVGGLTQPHIKPGKTFVYEFVATKGGTHMYHPHADEMVQMAMGMMGFLVIHPADPKFMRVDRDFVFLMSSYDIDPGSYVPKVMTMTDFNIWTWNSRVFPGIDPLVCSLGERIRVRIGNLTMTNHPIHKHGAPFTVTCTDGGWVPESARIPEVTTDVPVGAMRAFEFTADEPGDWAIHCHKSHHTMNAMGHEVNPQLVRWTAVRAQRDAELLAARLKAVPDVRVTAGWKHYRDTGDDAVRLGLSVQLPVFDQNRGGIIEAQEARSKADAEQNAARAALILTLGRAYETMVGAVKELEILRSSAVPNAQRALEAIESGYGQGRYTLLEVLDAQSTLAQASLREVEALVSFHTAVAVLEGLTGVPVIFGQRGRSR